MTTLKKCVDLLEKYMTILKKDGEDMKFELIDTCMDGKNKDTLFKVQGEEPEYTAFIKSIYGDRKVVTNVIKSESSVEEVEEDLIPLFCKITSKVVVRGILDDFENRRSVDAESFIRTLGKLKYPQFDGNDTSYVKNVCEETEVIEEIMESTEILVNNFNVEIEEESKEDKKKRLIAKNMLDEIMTVYDSLYAPCFVNKPVGILTKQGIIMLDKNLSPELDIITDTDIKPFYLALEMASNGYLKHDDNIEKEVDNTYIASDGSLLITYCPVYHLYNVYGVYPTRDGKKVEKNWSKFRDILEEITETRILTALNYIDFEDETAIRLFRKSLKELLTNCIIITEYNSSEVLNAKFKISTKMDNVGKIIKENSEEYMGSSIGEVISYKETSIGIYNFLYTFNLDKYTSSILFSYKMYDKLMASGIKPDSSNIIVGKKIDGQDHAINLAKEQNLVTCIVAGSGSGKGVLTLNILAGLVADGCPIMYVDFKPDMSATLWDLEKDLTSRGYPTKIYSIDSKNDVHKYGSLPVRSHPYGINALKGTKLDSSWRLIPYLKSLQLYALISDLRNSNLACSSDKKAFFIFDELQVFSKTYGAMYLEALKLSKMKIDKNTPPEKIEILQKHKDLGEKILDVFFMDMDIALESVIKTTGRSGLMGALVIGQEVNPNSWTVGKGKDVLTYTANPFYNFMTKSAIRLSGARHSTTNSVYSLSSVSYTGDTFIEANKMGYFAITESYTPPTKGDDIIVVKSYLTLNKNDVTKAVRNGVDPPDAKTFTGALLTGVTPVSKRKELVKTELMPNNKVNERVGFEGLVKALMASQGYEDTDAQLAYNLSLGYKLAEDALRYTGLLDKYTNVEDYLYDCDPSSFYTLEELKTLRVSNSGDTTTKGVDLSSPVYGSSEETPKEEIEKTPKELLKAMSSPDVGNTRETFYGDDMDSDKLVNEATPDYEEEDFNSGCKTDDIPVSNKAVGTGRTQQSRQDTSNTTDVDEAIRNERQTSPNEPNFSNTYSKRLDINPHLFAGFGKNGVSTAYAIKEVSKVILSQINQDFGLDRIHTFEVLGKGHLKINDCLFAPKLDVELIQALPFDLQADVSKGELAELFNFGDLYKFKNLELLTIENQRLAEGRVRVELGMKPKHSWMFLFKRFRNLQKVIISGADIADETTNSKYQNNYNTGFGLGERIANFFVGNKKPRKQRDYAQSNGITRMGGGLASTILNSRTGRVTSKAIGYTAGLKAVTLASSFFGPWGVLFGALAVYGTVSQAKKNGGLFADTDDNTGYTNRHFDPSLDVDANDTPKGKSKGDAKGKGVKNSKA